jgi:biopolymer transport protein ExbB
MISNISFVVIRKRWFVLITIVVALAVCINTSFAQSASDESTAGGEPYQMSLWSTIASGGFIGFVIILASLVAVALAVENFISIRRDRMVPEDLIERLAKYIKAKRYEQAQEACAEDGSFLAQVIGSGLNQVGAMFGFFDMQNAMQEVSEREVSKMYRKLEYLSFIASTSPMLGLLGTVTGMIRSFNTIAAAGGAANPSKLAGGISMALVTTCMGLIVAIPTMFFVAFFRKRIDGFVAEPETIVERLMGHFRSDTK